MFVHYRTQAFIFKKEERGEADQSLAVYTKDFGRLEIFAKAVRKISSKLRSAIQPFCLSEIEFIQGKNHKILTDAILLKKFKSLNNLKKLKEAYKISQALEKLIKGREPDARIWQLLQETFITLNDLKIQTPSESRKLEIIYYYFFWNFLSFLGLQPEFYSCLRCSKKIKPEKNYFSSKEGGLVCPICQKTFGLGREVQIETIKILRTILKKDKKTLLKLKFEADHLKELSLLSKSYFYKI